MLSIKLYFNEFQKERVDFLMIKWFFFVSFFLVLNGKATVVIELLEKVVYIKHHQVVKQ